MTPEQAFDLHHQAVFRFVYRLTQRADLAEDITQDCFLAYLRAGERFDAQRGTSLKTYLIAIARNLAFKWVRDYGRECQIDDPFESSTPSESGAAFDISTAVATAVASLAPLQQEALILFEYEGFTLEEIAAISGVDIGTVKSRLHRARERLRRILAPLKRVGDPNART
ncbi:MAG: RNA polymerase sigma factor [Bryobacteraceae bacterium]